MRHQSSRNLKEGVELTQSSYPLHILKDQLYTGVSYTVRPPLSEHLCAS